MNIINSQKKITILTPTYNRAHTLSRLYESLLYQGNKNFDWVIVDDGSSDDTRKVVEKFHDDYFEIKYFYKANGGKHTAINYGMKYINTDYTFIVDSDDYLCDSAIELINEWIEDVDNDIEFAGVAGVRIKDYQGYNIIGQFPKGYEYIDCLNSERRGKKLMGDKAEIYRTELLKNNPFPEFKDEKFIPESVIWNKFSNMGLKVRWHKEGIVVCQYVEGGLTSEMKNIEHFVNNFKGYTEDCRISLKAFRFPYNISAGSVFCAKCIATGRAEKNMKCFDTSALKRCLMVVLGKIRHMTGRY